MRKKRSQNNQEQSGGSWMDTYGDLVTLLLCFFVLLFSFSTIDAAKWEALVQTFSGAAGVISDHSPGISQPLFQNNVVKPNEYDWYRPDQTDPDPPEERPETIPPDPSPEATATPMPSPTVEPTATPKATQGTTQATTTAATTTASTTKTQTTSSVPKPTASPTPEPTPTPEPDLDLFYSELESYFDDVSMADAVQIQYDGNRITVRLIASIIFEPGSDRLVPQAETILRGAAAIVSDYRDDIGAMRTEGHTDDRFEDESEANDAFKLASDRAVRVNRFLLNHSTLPESLASVSGHGSNNPVASNDSEAGRNLNNRVDIVLSN